MSMTTTNSDEVSVVPAARSVPLVAGDTPAMREWAEQLVARARAEGVELTGDDGLLTAMIRQVLQTGLEVELSDHLGYEPHDPAGRGSGNRGHFPNEQAAMKILYLVAHQRRPGRSNLIGKTNGWKHILNALTIHYGDRITNINR